MRPPEPEIQVRVLMGVLPKTPLNAYLRQFSALFLSLHNTVSV